MSQHAPVFDTVDEGGAAHVGEEVVLIIIHGRSGMTIDPRTTIFSLPVCAKTLVVNYVFML